MGPIEVHTLGARRAGSELGDYLGAAPGGRGSAGGRRDLRGFM